MTLFPVGRTSATGVAILLLAGCGGSSATTTIPQGSSAVRETGQHSGSWRKPGSSSGDLLYATGGCNGTCVLSYPGLQLVGEIPDNGTAICSDTQGNIFMPNDTKVTEYAHGGASPIATLTLPGNLAGGCSVDPATNNLAVVYDSEVAIFQNEQGTPTVYSTVIGPSYCAYDGNGNLFVDGRNGQTPALAELPLGQSQFITLSINSAVGNPGQIQWDGRYLDYQSFSKYGKLSQLQITGSSATIIGTTTLKGVRHRATQSWIFNNDIIVPYNIHGPFPNVIGAWHYPKGGKVIKTIRKFDSYKKRQITFHGVTVSVQPQ